MANGEVSAIKSAKVHAAQTASAQANSGQHVAQVAQATAKSRESSHRIAFDFKKKPS